MVINSTNENKLFKTWLSNLKMKISCLKAWL